MKWILIPLFLQVPFRLALRLWDIYLLDGERILTAMAYNILKLHGKHLLKLGMDDILHFLQVGNFFLKSIPQLNWGLASIPLLLVMSDKRINTKVAFYNFFLPQTPSQIEIKRGRIGKFLTDTVSTCQMF